MAAKHDNAFRMPGVVQTISGMLREFEIWKRITDTPDESGWVSTAYEVKYVYVGPDGVSRGIDRSDLDIPEGIDGGTGPLPGTYEIHIVDSTGIDLIEPFRGEHVTYDSMATRRRPEEALANTYSTALQDMEAVIRNQRARLNDADRREKSARDDLYSVRDQLTKANSEVATYKLVAEKASSEAKADRERCEAYQAELEQLRGETALFKPHVGMIVDEGIRRLCEMAGFPMPAANTTQDEPGGDPMPQGIGCEDPLALLEMYVRITLANPYSARYLIQNSKLFTPPGVLNWKLVRAILWTFYKRDFGAVPDWRGLCEDWDAMLAEEAAEEGTDQEHAAAE